MSKCKDHDEEARYCERCINTAVADVENELYLRRLPDPATIAEYAATVRALMYRLYVRWPNEKKESSCQPDRWRKP